MELYSRFREVQLVLKKYGNPTTYLRPIQPTAENDPDGQAALDLYHKILQELATAYSSGDMEDAAHIAEARRLMFELNAKAEDMAARDHGVPFFPAQSASAPKKSRSQQTRKRQRV
jgi:hypothetical protein